MILYVPGEPKAKPRPRACQIGGHVHIYQPEPKDWVKAIEAIAKKNKPSTPLEPPLLVDILFIIPHPKSHYRTGKNSDILKLDSPILHTIKPDRDNLDKLVLDVLQDAGYFENDSGVAVGTILKIWGPLKRAGAYIRILELDQDLVQFAEWIQTMQSGAQS